METDISSIAFQEDFLLWTELSVENKVINIKRAVNDSLPILINNQTIQQSTSAKLIANQLNAIVQKYEIKSQNVRIAIPGRFSNIKKIVIDESIPEDSYRDLVVYEFEKSWDEQPENYQIFMPEFMRENGAFRELLAVAIRKSILKFFEEICESAQIQADIITPSCFTVDEFFRSLHPEIDEHALILGWQRRGYDVIISDKQNFINYCFRPYNFNLDPIEQVDEEGLLSAFNMLFEEIQHPSALEQPLYNIQSIYFYGYHFKLEWLETIKRQVNVPVNLLNLDQSSIYKLAPESQEVTADRIFQLIEPISNIF